MKEQFDVWRYAFPVKGEHPVVIISPPARASRAKYVNVLFCTSQRQSRQPYPFEVMLNGVDGMDWETFCDCSVFWTIESDKLFGKRGHVCQARRMAIRRMIRDLYRLSSTD